MNKITIIILCLLFFSMGIVEGYMMHEVKEKSEIQLEAHKLFDNRSYNKDIIISNITCVGEINGR